MPVMNGSFRKWLPAVSYPVVITGSILLYLLLKTMGLPLLAATYIPVLLAASAVTWLEVWTPHFEEWKPASADVRNDLMFMLVVQMVLPKALTFLAAISILTWLDARSLTFTNFWPHALPIGVQVVMMVLVADFFRYWFHVLSHNTDLFWRLHAVHHSPEKLYWLNVGRFHPIEKALQFLLDALPFIIVGVQADVVALYFVFYGVNGFFQHSNVELKMGPLNYLISSAELHRWHHSRIPEESNTNYGNNTIVWDILFRTRFLPPDRDIRDIGLLDREYPMDFVSQLGTPFRNRRK